MQVLATQQILEQARKAPDSLIQALGNPSPSMGSLARCVDGKQVLGFTKDAEQVKLWYLVEPQPAHTPPFASIARSELRALGVPSDLAPSVQRLVTAKQIDALILPEAVKDMLRFLFLQLTMGLHADSSALTRKATDLDHLADYLHGRVTELLLNLEPSQERVVRLGDGGTIVVQGVAGSGKTAVALHRIHRLMAQGNLLVAPRVIFLTFNRALAAAARELLTALCGQALRNVEVETMHKWCMKLAGIHGHQMMREKERRGRLEESVATVRAGAQESALWSYPLSFWEEEIHRIKGRVLGGQTEYLTMQRHGAQRPLARPLREMVWNVYETHTRTGTNSGRLNWDDVIRQAHQCMVARGDSAPRYDYVFVDEAQDLTPLGINVAARLARAPGELFIGFDAAQSIYERGFRWKDVGVTVHGGRSFAFKRNYRNTQAILDAARPVLAAVHKDHGAQGDTSDLLEPEAAVRQGNAPRHLSCAPLKEADAIAAEIRRLLQTERVNPGNVAVLAYPNKVKRAIFHRLKEHGVICQEHDHNSEIRLSDPSVKVLPMKSAKGLEFPVVFLVAAGRNFQPPSKKMDEHEVTAYLGEMRRVFYVAMTRAMSDLLLVYPDDDPPPFLVQETGTPDQTLNSGVDEEYELIKQIFATRQHTIPTVSRTQTKIPTVSRTQTKIREAVAQKPEAPVVEKEPQDEPDLHRTLEAIYTERRTSWSKLLALFGLPEGVGITKYMTLAEARSLANNKRVVGPKLGVVAQGKTRFHRPDCKWLNPKNAVRHYKNRQAAIAEGLVPCGTCRP